MSEGLRNVGFFWHRLNFTIPTKISAATVKINRCVEVKHVHRSRTFRRIRRLTEHSEVLSWCIEVEHSEELANSHIRKFLVFPKFSKSSFCSCRSLKSNRCVEVKHVHRSRTFGRFSGYRRLNIPKFSIG